MRDYSFAIFRWTWRAANALPTGLLSTIAALCEIFLTFAENGQPRPKAAVNSTFVASSACFYIRSGAADTDTL